MPGLQLHLLGPPYIEGDNVRLEFDTRKNVALLAYLAVTGEYHSREALVTLLWPELDPSRARAGLRRNLSNLKKAFAGRWLDIRRDRVGLVKDADLWLDVRQFRGLLDSWLKHGHQEMYPCPTCRNDRGTSAPGGFGRFDDPICFSSLYQRYDQLQIHVISPLRLSDRVC